MAIWWRMRSSRFHSVIAPMSAIFVTCGIDRLIGAITLFDSRFYYALAVSKISTVVVGAVALYRLARFSSSASSQQMAYTVGELSVTEEAQVYADTQVDGCFVTAGDGGNLAVNDAFKTVTGYGILNTRGYRWAQPVHDEDRRRYVSAWIDFVGGRATSFNQKIRWWYPSRGWVHLHVIGYRRANGTFAGTVADITHIRSDLT